jgi:hypothetical protein
MNRLRIHIDRVVVQGGQSVSMEQVEQAIRHELTTRFADGSTLAHGTASMHTPVVRVSMTAAPNAWPATLARAVANEVPITTSTPNPVKP